MKIFKVLLGLQIVYLTTALLTGVLPGWSMFSRLENPDFTMVDLESGQAVDVRAYLPKVQYEMGAGTVKNLAVFLCEKHRNRIALEIKTSKMEKYEITPDECALQPR